MMIIYFKFEEENSFSNLRYKQDIIKTKHGYNILLEQMIKKFHFVYSEQSKNDVKL